MERDYVGKLATSKAGHDAGTLYIIIKEEAQYVYLADGKTKLMERPKKKKKKHIQLIEEKHDVVDADNIAIKRIVKEFNNQR